MEIKVWVNVSGKRGRVAIPNGSIVADLIDAIYNSRWFEIRNGSIDHISLDGQNLAVDAEVTITGNDFVVHLSTPEVNQETIQSNILNMVKEWWNDHNILEYDDGSIIMEFKKVNPFGYYTILYVRECYNKLANEIIKKDTAPRSLITGNPGIGKSCFLVYLLFILVHEYKKTVVYRHLNVETGVDHNVYCFNEDGIRAENDVKLFWNELNNPNTWYLVDTIENPGLVQARTVMVASPRPGNTRTFIKYGGVSMYYMPTWSNEELFKIAPYYKVNEEDLTKYIYLYGGIPRYIFDKEGTTKDRQNNALASPNLEKCMEVMGKEGLNEVSHFLVKIVPDDTLKGYSIDFASMFVATELTKRFKNDQLQGILRVIKYRNEPIFATFRGHTFEEYAHLVISNGGEFQVRCLSGNIKTTSTISLPLRNTAIVHTFTFSEKDDNYYKPNKVTFPAIDAWTKEGFFQMTVTSKHPVKMKFLSDMMSRNFPIQNALYFVVPEDNFKDFKQQTLKMPKLKQTQQPKDRKKPSTPKQIPITNFFTQPTKKRKFGASTSSTEVSFNTSQIEEHAKQLCQWVLAIPINPEEIISQSKYFQPNIIQ